MPRYLASRRWRKTRQRLPNSTTAGAVGGTPGTLPRRWELYAPDAAQGISTQVVGLATEDGIDCLDWRVFGTPSTGSVGLRSTTNAAFGSRTNTTFNKPTGATTGDVLVCLMFVGAQTTSPGVTPPAGWFEQQTPGSYTDGGGFQAIWRIFTRPAGGSEPATYTFTHTTASTEGLMYCLTGVDVNNPILVGSRTEGLGTLATAPSLTTTRNNSFVINWVVAWGAATSAGVPAGTTPTFTSRFIGTVDAFADGVLATAGATGQKDTSLPSNGATDPNFGVLIAMQPAVANVGFSGVFFTPANLLGIPPIIPCRLDDFVTLSAYVRLAGGSLPTSVSLGVNFLDAGFDFLGNGVTLLTPTTTPSLRDQRRVVTAHCTQAGTAWCAPNVTLGYGGALDCTLRIGGPQLEIGSVMTAYERRIV